jgi:hypothetical protein
MVKTSKQMMHPPRSSHRRFFFVTTTRTVQGAILLTVAIAYFLAFDNNAILPTYYLAIDGTVHRSLASFRVANNNNNKYHPVVVDHHDDDDERDDKVRGLAAISTQQEQEPEHLRRRKTLHDYFLETNTSMIRLTQDGIDTVMDHSPTDDKPLRHVRFSHLILPKVRPDDPIMTTAYTDATVIQKAPWFSRDTICKDTCCAQPVAVSMTQDETRIINAVDGQDLADGLLFGHSLLPHHQFVASELTQEMIPCLQPGVIIHADSYR